ncbi:alpha/beta hydrolase fold domain-containing protein [Geodermatophilus sp. URMC 62]|uniref:alpha/beta hydrolase fold domain-containing protein n=1 Tax=Geodermatophilus sp. URMC 62 TaxID=3423414 RepID=UPI00406CC33C
MTLTSLADALYARFLATIATRLVKATPISLTTRSVPATETVSIPTRHGSIRAFVTRPAADAPLASGTPPVHLHFHGGAFLVGAPWQDEHLARLVAGEVGATVVNVDYTTAYGTRFPRAHEEAYDALRWVRSSGQAMGWDADRVSVSGVSAGGNLALAVIEQARRAGDPPLRAAALIVPFVDAAAGAAEFVSPMPAGSGAPAPFVNERLVRVSQENYFADATRRTDPLASPVYNDAGMATLPPTLVVTAERDSVRVFDERFTDKARNAGAAIDYLCIPGVDHGFPESSKEQDQAGIRQLAEAVRAHLTEHLDPARPAGTSTSGVPSHLGETMRALHVPAAGAAIELGDLPTPTAGEGTVLIRVKAAGLNALDNGLASGMMAGMMPHEYPLVLGRDAAGVVEGVGDGVSDLAVGDEVFGHVLLVPPIKMGTLAEYAVLPAASVAKKPAGLDDVTAAALPLAGAAAAQSVDAVQPQSGQTVLVNGADGGVGSYAVQLLAARGVTVVATGTPASADRLRQLGATTIVDWTAGPVVDQVRDAYPDGVDALVNVAGFDPAQVPAGAVRSGGAVASTTALPDEQALSTAGLTGTSIMARPTREVITPLAEQAASGALTVSVSSVVPLEQAADALGALAAGKANGKIVVTLDA